MKERNEAQEKAAETGNPDDWRMYRAIRNQVTASCRKDKAVWEREKLDHINNTSTDTWQTVKGWLGWGSAGTPTKLFSDGRLVTSPGGLAACMNNFFLDKILREEQKNIFLCSIESLGIDCLFSGRCFMFKSSWGWYNGISNEISRDRCP